MIIQPRLKQDTTPYNPVLAKNTPDQILAAAQSGVAKDIWKVGDSIPIHIQGIVGDLTIDDTYYAVIIGFDHNSEYEGTNTIHFQIAKDASGMNIAFCDSKYSKNGTSDGFRMIASTNTDDFVSWKDSYMRNTICSQFFEVLPSEWQAVISECYKYVSFNPDGVTYSPHYHASKDKIFLPSAYEVMGDGADSSQIASGESKFTKQYDFYADENNRNFYRHDDKTACKWWTRTAAPYHIGSIGKGHYNFIYEDGSSNYNASMNISYGFTPCFKVGGSPEDFSPDFILANNSWETIAKVTKLALAEAFWNVGDTIDIQLTGKYEQTLTLQIYSSLGNNATEITFGCKDLMKETMPINSSTDIVSYSESEIYATLSEILECFPEELKPLVRQSGKETLVKESATSYNTTKKTISCYLFLLSYGEVQGGTGSSGDGNTYRIFSDAKSRIKRLNNGSGEISTYWLRSAYKSPNYWYSVYTNGNPTNSIMTNKYGICFAFRI